MTNNNKLYPKKLIDLYNNRLYVSDNDQLVSLNLYRAAFSFIMDRTLLRFYNELGIPIRNNVEMEAINQ